MKRLDDMMPFQTSCHAGDGSGRDTVQLTERESTPEASNIKLVLHCLNCEETAT